MAIAQITPIKPRALKPGATIGIVAPASPFKRDDLEQGLAILQNMGFGVRLAEGLFDTRGYLAGEDFCRAAQLQEMFGNVAVDAIMCARGGFGCMRILPLLDYELIRVNPKLLMGFSDITALHHALFVKAGLVTLHGPVVCTLGKADDSTRSSALQAFSGTSPNRLTAPALRAIQPGKGEGRLVGGNLSTLCHLLGTPFAPSYADCILFVEDRGEALYRIDRMLVQMKLAGCFEGVAGIVLGSFKDCGDEADIGDLVAQLFAGSDVPISAGWPAGHGECNWTLPLGIMARLDADKGELAFMESVTAQ
ncbi:MAG: LD-carboxypeptidase [Desulfatitalea sp.]